MKPISLPILLMLSACSPSPAAMIAQLGDTPADAIASDAKLKPVALRLGAQVFDSNCVACHGSDLKGAPGQHAANLADDYWLYGGIDLDTFIMKPSDVEQTILHGIRADDPKTRFQTDMPARGLSKVMDDGEISDVVDYVWSYNGGTIDGATRERGREMFIGEGSCNDCHASDGRGNSGIGAPSLKRPDTWQWGHDKASLRATVTNGHAGNSCPSFIDKLKPAEIRAVAVYVLSKAAALKF